jgi:hypothetical protein
VRKHLLETNGNRVITKCSPKLLAEHIKTTGMTETRQYEKKKKNREKVVLGNRGPYKKRTSNFKSFEICSGIIRTIRGFAGKLLV